MRIIARSTLREYWQKHPDTEQPLKAWFDDTSRANWKTPSDIKENYANASIMGASQICNE
jgi:mRNA interferase HigB